MSDYATMMDLVRRERETETQIRAMDAWEIVRLVHGLEDELAAAESTIEGQLGTIKALTEGTDGSTPALVQIARMEERLAAAEADAATQRDKVRVMRETLEELLAYVETGYGDFGSDEGAQAHAALATTEDV
jgi:hypothetical protein